MNKTFAAALLFSASSLLAAPPTLPAQKVAELRAYTTNALVTCGDGVLTFQPLNVPEAPMNFAPFDATVKSKSDDSCNTHKYVLYSPTSGQIIIGTVFVVPQDPRPVLGRIKELTSGFLKADVDVTLAPLSLPDGLKPVQILKQTSYGPFSYGAYLDASEHFFMVGRRGNLKIDPAKSLREALRVDALAVRRGNPKAKLEIIEFSDFECPSCGSAHKILEPILAKNLSKINFGRIDLPLYEHHEWAMAAALGGHAIAKVAPAKYWEYADFLFRNQETVGRMPFDKTLQNFCEDHDISWEKVLPLYRSPVERQAILDEESRAFDNGFNATPTFIVNGRVMDFGPEGVNVLNAMKAAGIAVPAAAGTKK